MEKLIEEMIAISNEKRKLMREILDVTKRQSIFIDLGKVETLIKQIKIKEKIINEVNKLDLKFYNIYNEIKKRGVEGLDKLDVEKYPQLKELKEIVNDILSITKETKVIEDENIQKIQREKGNLSIKMKGIRQGIKVSNAYSSQKNLVKSVLFDKKK